MAQSRKSSRKPRLVRPAAGAQSVVQNIAQPIEDISTAPPAEPLLPAAEPPPPARVSVLQLGASLSIREVGECAVRLRPMLAGGPTVIDASALETIDTAGIQLLLAAAASAQHHGFKLKLLSAMGVKNGAARALGLSEHLSELTEVLP